MFRMNTRWPLYGDFSDLFKYVSLLLSLFVGVLCIKRYEGSRLLLIIAIGLIVFIVGRNSDNIFQMYLTYLIIIGAKDIPFRDIVKAHFILALCFCVFNMTVSELGWVRKSVTFVSNEREGVFGDNVVRKDFGYGWATDYAIHVFFILLDYWLLKGGRLKLLEYVVYVLICLFIIINCDSRMAAGTIIIILLFAIYLLVLEKKHRELNRIMDLLCIFSVPIFGAISIYATINYDDSDLSWVAADIILSGRLSLGYEAIQDVGIPWLGQIFKMYGAGNSGTGVTEYNFLDCAYIQSIVIWGIILTGIWVYAYVVISIKAKRSHNYVLMSAIFISSISGVIAPYLYNLKYCILLLAIFAIDENCISKDTTESIME